MLNTMRRNLKSLHWVLWLVVASFVLFAFAVWGGGAGPSAGASANWMARVNGEPVSFQRFQNAYYNLDRFYRQIYADSYDARTLGVARQALEQLIREQIIVEEARRLGLRASPQEVSRAITRDPSFQIDGRFMGRSQYQKFLSDRGIDVTSFEAGVADDLLAEKYRRLVTDSITVTSDEVLDDYRSRNEKVKADYFVLEAEPLGADIVLDEDALRAYFDSHAGDYTSPERRRAAYVLINQESLGGSATVPEDEVRAYFDDNRERLYSTPEQVRVSQILLNVVAGATPEEVDEVRLRAEDLHLQIGAGEDFGELARIYSEHASQSQGGDMGFIRRGQMRPEFDDAAFALEIGGTSELVRTDVGFHIIRVTERREASTRPFAEVRDSIARQLTFSREQQIVSEAVRSFREEIQGDPGRFDLAAEKLGLTIEDTGLLSSDGSVPGLGEFPQVTQAIFRLQPGAVSPAVPVPQGTVFLKTEEVRPPEPLSFEAARSRVEADYRRAQAIREARARVETEVAGGADLAALALSFGATVESSNEFTRSANLAPFTSEARRVAFDSPAGAVAAPVEIPEGLLVFSVTERQEMDTAAFEQAEDNLRRSLVQRRRNLLFTAVVDRLHADSQIQINQARLDQIAGRGA